MFRTRLRLHLSKSRQLQKEFESKPAFYQEVLEVERKGQANKGAAASQLAPEAPQDAVTPGLRHKPLAIMGLASLIEEMDKALNDRISDLESRTNQMVEMVGVHAFRKGFAVLDSMTYSYAGIQPSLDLRGAKVN